ncbi:MAG: hypothetical protein U1C46_04850 [Bacteroidales bacterium]|nr:hypothetical protein [Bacteroidales bacterium]MDZ4204129.1 hypothetical protein [Bacteroidales bacterium]
MPEETTNQPATKSRICEIHKCGHENAFYFLGFIGAAIYYISAASTFWMGVLGVLKAIVWPAFLVYELLKFLGM